MDKRDEREQLPLVDKLKVISAKLSDLDIRANEAVRERSSHLKQSAFLITKPIGFIRSAYPCKNGTPRQGSLCADITASLTIGKDTFTNASHALDDLKEFTHVWIVFWFHLNDGASVKAKVKPPRLGGLTSKSVFATRSPHRPNPLGLSLARLDKIVGDTIFFSGVDLVDGTPVLDIKPFIEDYDVPLQAEKKAETNRYDLTWVSRADGDNQQHLDNVLFTPKALNNLVKFHNRCENNCKHCLNFIDDSLLTSTVNDLLISDLRSGYRKNHCSDRIHFITLDSMKLSVWYDDDGCAQVLNVIPRNFENATEDKPENDVDEIATKLRYETTL